MTHLYIVVVQDDGEEFQYEFGNLNHAQEHFDSEKNAVLVEYIKGKHNLIKAK